MLKDIAKFGRHSLNKLTLELFNFLVSKGGGGGGGAHAFKILLPVFIIE